MNPKFLTGLGLLPLLSLQRLMVPTTKQERLLSRLDYAEKVHNEQVAAEQRRLNSEGYAKAEAKRARKAAKLRQIEARAALSAQERG